MMESGETYSSFGRRQFPRDSGCYDAALKVSHQSHVSPQGESDDNNINFSDGTNNLDSVVEQCNHEILARVKQAQKNALNLKEDVGYLPNIPNSISSEKLQRRAKDSYVSVHGQTTLTDPCRRNLINRMSGRKTNPNTEDTCEADQKLNTVKYVVGAGIEEATTTTVISRGGCFSEKSSDSGVSSSSLSSSNIKEQRQPVPSQNITENPTHTFPNCAKNSSSNTAN